MKRPRIHPIGTAVMRERITIDGCGPAPHHCEAIVGLLDDGARVNFANRCPNHWNEPDGAVFTVDDDEPEVH